MPDLFDTLTAALVPSTLRAKLRTRPSKANAARVKRIEVACRHMAKEASGYVSKEGTALVPRGMPVMVVHAGGRAYSHLCDPTAATKVDDFGCDPIAYAMDGIRLGAEFFPYPVDHSSDDLRQHMFFPLLAATAGEDSLAEPEPTPKRRSRRPKKSAAN